MENLRKGREIIGLPVVSLTSGEELGAVEDLLWNEQEGRLSGLVLLEAGAVKRQRLLPFDQIKCIGADAVTVQAEDLAAECPPEDGRLSLLNGLPVLSEEGESLGTIEDFVFSPEDGRVEGYDLSAGLVGDLLSGRCLIPRQAVVVWGKESVVVSKSGIEKRGEDHAVSDLPQQPDR
jgi:uncharacterized protein YrrD